MDGAEVHVLGYFLDHGAGWLGELLRELRAERAGRIHRITERLAALGLPVDPDEVLALVREGSAGRPHVAQVMVRKGYVATVKEAFDRYLRAGGPAYVSHRKLSFRDACEVIHGPEAWRSWPARLSRRGPGAHPQLAGERRSRAWSATTPSTPRADGGFVGLCRELDLVPTGGSDFHGPAVRAATLGQPPVPRASYDALRRGAGR